MCSVRFTVLWCFERIDICLLQPLHFLLCKVHRGESPDSSSSWCFFRTNQPQDLVSNMVLKKMLRSFFSKGQDKTRRNVPTRNSPKWGRNVPVIGWKYDNGEERTSPFALRLLLSGWKIATRNDRSRRPRYLPCEELYFFPGSKASKSKVGQCNKIAIDRPSWNNNSGKSRLLLISSDLLWKNRADGWFKLEKNVKNRVPNFCRPAEIRSYEIRQKKNCFRRSCLWKIIYWHV